MNTLNKIYSFKFLKILFCFVFFNSKCKNQTNKIQKHLKKVTKITIDNIKIKNITGSKVIFDGEYKDQNIIKLGTTTSYDKSYIITEVYFTLDQKIPKSNFGELLKHHVTLGKHCKFDVDPKFKVQGKYDGETVDKFRLFFFIGTSNKKGKFVDTNVKFKINFKDEKQGEASSDEKTLKFKALDAS